MAQVARRVDRARAAIRADRRNGGGAACIVEVMAAEGTIVDPADVIVTTGGQQVIDLVCKTLIDPGRRDRRRGAHLPGRGPDVQRLSGRCRADRDGRRRHADRRARGTLDRLQAEGRRPKFIYTIPNFQNPGGVTMSLARRRRLVEVARERELLVLEDNPYGLLRYEGEPLPTLYSLDAANRPRRRLRPRDLPGHVLEDPLARPAARLGGRAAAGAGEDEPRQTGRRPLQLAGHAAVRRRVLRRARRLAAATSSAEAPVQPPARRDAGTRWRSTSARRRAGRGPRAACSSGRRCPTTSTRPTCWRARWTARAWRSCPAGPPTWTAAAAQLDAPELRRRARRRTSARRSGGSARSCASRSGCSGR